MPGRRPADDLAGRRSGRRAQGTPVTEAYRVPFRFTGKIVSITIELKDVKAAEHDEAEKARAVARLKKALAD